MAELFTTPLPCIRLEDEVRPRGGWRAVEQISALERHAARVMGSRLRFHIVAAYEAMDKLAAGILATQRMEMPARHPMDVHVGNYFPEAVEATRHEPRPFNGYMKNQRSKYPHPKNR